MSDAAFIAQCGNLSALYVKHFWHDITFGAGACALLSNDPTLPLHYYQHRPAMMYTDKTGRTLPDGIYLNKFLHDAQSEYQEVMQWYRQSYGFQYAVSFVKREKDRQHMFSFTFDCDEQTFLYLITDYLHSYKQYITHYRKNCHDLIERVSEDKNQIMVPLSDVSKPAVLELSLCKEMSAISQCLEKFSDQLSPQQTKCMQYILLGLSAKEIAFEMALSTRTVEHYLTAIKAKLGCKNKNELIATYAGQAASSWLE